MSSQASGCEPLRPDSSGLPRQALLRQRSLSPDWRPASSPGPCPSPCRRRWPSTCLRNQAGADKASAIGQACASPARDQSIPMSRRCLASVPVAISFMRTSVSPSRGPSIPTALRNQGSAPRAMFIQPRCVCLVQLLPPLSPLSLSESNPDAASRAAGLRLHRQLHWRTQQRHARACRC